MIAHHTGLTGLLFMLLIGWLASRQRRDWSKRCLPRFKQRWGLWRRRWEKFEREHEGER